jgi:hypothetical protein
MKGSAQTIPGLSHQVLVQIEIARGRIHCYPHRACETVVYKPRRARMPAPARPLEVRWVVTGLRDAQVILIVPKARTDRTFARGKPFQIGPGTNTITSGHPSHGAGPGHCYLWRYDILLYSRVGGRVLARLDPGVIIKDYP